jgi:hypothetical protein
MLDAQFSNGHDRQPLHRHDAHDLLVFVIEGHGHMHIGDEERASP